MGKECYLLEFRESGEIVERIVEKNFHGKIIFEGKR